MTLDHIRAVLSAHLAAGWSESGRPRTPIAWPNQPFTPPVDRIWIRPVVRPGLAVLAEQGDEGLGLRRGVLCIGVFGPLGSGTAAILARADQLEALFRRQYLDGLLTGEPASQELGDDGHGFYHVSVTVPFHAWIGA